MTFVASQMPPTDALAGLRELFSEHPGILEPSTALVVQSCSRLIGDEVRIYILLLISVFLDHC